MKNSILPKGAKTSWDFSSLYSGVTDKKIESDIVIIEKAHDAFAKKYAKYDSYITNEKALLGALKDWEKLMEITGATKPLWYLSILQTIDSQNQKITSQLALFEPRMINAGNKTLFFGLKIGKINKDLQQKVLKNKTFLPYAYFLKQIFDTAQYDLSEAEEKIMSLKSRPARSMWVESFEKLLANQTVAYKGNELPLSEAANKIHQLPIKERYALHAACMKVLKKNSYFCESELNAIYSDKKINDELRGFKNPYSATILGYQNNEKSILALVDTVTKNFAISNRFLKLKAKLLNLNVLSYADRNVGIGKNENKISFEDSYSIIKKGFASAGQYYVDVLDSMLQKGHVDVYPKKGKRGGAFCASGFNVPTVVLLNNVNSLDSVMTYAHEMGHAIHSELSRTQPVLYESYTISTAEVASTFFENLAFEEVFKTLSPKEQIVALHDRIQDFISTIFRQIACFNFELDIHNGIRQKGALSKEELAALHNKNMSAYLGSAVKMNEIDGYFFVQWSHIRNFFYVYSYAYGALISRALYKKYKEDPSYITKIDSFMKAGGSMSPEDIFKSIGIDTSKPEFFEEGLKSIADDIKRLEKLAKEAKMI